MISQALDRFPSSFPSYKQGQFLRVPWPVAVIRCSRGLGFARFPNAPSDRVNAVTPLGRPVGKLLDYFTRTRGLGVARPLACIPDADPIRATLAHAREGAAF